MAYRIRTLEPTETPHVAGMRHAMVADDFKGKPYDVCFFREAEEAAIVCGAMNDFLDESEAEEDIWDEERRQVARELTGATTVGAVS